MVNVAGFVAKLFHSIYLSSWLLCHAHFFNTVLVLKTGAFASMIFFKTNFRGDDTQGFTSKCVQENFPLAMDIMAAKSLIDISNNFGNEDPWWPHLKNLSEVLTEN
jgi:hypothetical protein